MLRNKSENAMQLGTQAAGEYIPPTRRQQLENKKFQLERELDVVKAAIAALDAHPDLEEFSEVLSRAGV